MTPAFFNDASTIRARALYVGQRIELRALESLESLAMGPLVVRAGSAGVAVLFRHGTVVVFNLTASESLAFLREIESLITDRFSEPEQEENEIFLDANEPEGIAQGRIRLHAWSTGRLQIIADALAKSVVLAHYEEQLGRHLERIEPLAAALQRGKRLRSTAKELLQHVGDTLVTEARMIGRVEVGEKPELAWEHPEHERLYLRLEDEYELRERHQALDRKLALISRTAETLLGLLHNSRSLRVEWYIVFLILVEIVITIADKIW